MNRKKREYGPHDRRKQPRHRESSPESEAAALFLALPLRQAITIIDGGMRCVLECGHAVSLAPTAFDKSVRIRCRECYNEQMAKTEIMVEFARILGDSYTLD